MSGVDLSTGEALRDIDRAERGRRVRLLIGFLRPHRRSVIISLVSMAAMTGLDLLIPLLFKAVIDRGGFENAAPGEINMDAVWVIIGLATLAVLLRWIAYYINIISNLFGMKVLADVRVRLFSHVQNQGLAFFHRYKTGVVISRLTNDVDALQNFVLDGIWMVLRNVGVLIGIEIVLFAMDAKLALAVNLVLPIMLAATMWFRSHSMTAYRLVRERLALVTSHLAESLGGVRVIQAFAAEKRMAERFHDVADEHYRANMRTVWLNAAYFPVVEFISVVATGIVLWYGGLLAADDALTLGVLFAFIAYLNDFFDPIQQLSQFYNSYLAAMAALDKIADVLDVEPTIQDRPGAAPLERVDGRLTLDGVTFRYAPELPDVLHDVRLDVAPGEHIAVVGATGAGKSTLVKLVGRFYDPDTGAVRIDGTDVRDVPAVWLRRQLGMVPQESFLFAGTVRNNIRFSRPDATDAEIEVAVAALGADEILGRLTDGLDTEVGERGDMLSAGEQQLVSFARAMLMDPPVLVLDEATSSVDVTTEKLLIRSLERLLEGRTAIIVAHRLSTIRDADRIIVVDDGRIQEEGSHDQLVTAGGAYAGLYGEWERSAAAAAPPAN